MKELAIRIAEKNHISTTTFSNLIGSESSWNPDIEDSPEGDRGLLQINSKWHAEVKDTCAYDPLCAMEWSAKRIADGYGYEWTSMNCYAYVKWLVPNLPLQNKILPNSTPQKGGVAIFQYKDLPHYAYVTEIKTDGFSIKESNYIAGKITTRFIKWDDPHLKGFWKAQDSS